MPVHKEGAKYAIGSGKAMYTSKAKAERAYAAYRAKKHDSHSVHIKSAHKSEKKK